MKVDEEEKVLSVRATDEEPSSSWHGLCEQEAYCQMHPSVCPLEFWSSSEKCVCVCVGGGAVLIVSLRLTCRIISCSSQNKGCWLRSAWDGLHGWNQQSLKCQNYTLWPAVKRNCSFHSSYCRRKSIYSTGRAVKTLPFIGVWIMRHHRRRYSRRFYLSKSKHAWCQDTVEQVWQEWGVMARNPRGIKRPDRGEKQCAIFSSSFFQLVEVISKIRWFVIGARCITSWVNEINPKCWITWLHWLVYFTR